MQTYAIIELEEGALTVTRGESDGRTTRIVHCQRMALADLGHDALADALRSISGELLHDAFGVHVILGERRMQHFVSTLPKMPVADVNSFIVREALRLTTMPTAEEVLVAPRVVRRLKGGRYVVAATALPRSVWEPLRETFSACNLPVLSLTSMEACLALGAETESDQPWAIVECTAGRARFVLCDGKSVVQVRRFMVGSAEESAEAFAAQLVMELPRTVDWLREMGHANPVTLVLGNRPGIGPDALDLTRGDVAVVVRSTLGSDVEVDQEVPSVATAALLRELTRGEYIPSLLASPQLCLPPSKWRLAALGAGLAAGVLCTWSAVQDFGQVTTLWDGLANVKAEREQLHRRVLESRSGVPAPVLSTADASRLETALGMRRPVSRLVAEVCNTVTPGILIDNLQFASNERVVLSGVVSGPTRTAALAALAQFASSVQALPYLLAGAQEDVYEVAGEVNQFRFRLGVAWRNS